jgi:hypothetical protein
MYTVLGKLTVLFFVLLTTLHTNASDRLSVGLFHGAHYVRASIKCPAGSYEIYADNALVGTIFNNQLIEVSAI